MSLSFKKFCAKCGKETDALVSSLCNECFIVKHPLFSIKEFKIDFCVKCEKILVKGKWVPFDEKAIIEEIKSKIKPFHDLEQPKILVELSRKDDLEFDVSIVVEGFVDSVLIKQEKAFSLKLSKVSCDPCMRLGANYREGVIQIRVKEPALQGAVLEFLKKMIAQQRETNSLSGITKVFKTDVGLDVWVGSKKASAKAVREASKVFGLRVNISKKLIGEERDRSPRYRYTFCLKK